MYLTREIQDLDGRAHPMVGLFPFTVRMLPRLKALGYREVTLTAPGLLGPAGPGPGVTNFTIRKSSASPTAYPGCTV